MDGLIRLVLCWSQHAAAAMAGPGGLRFGNNRVEVEARSPSGESRQTKALDPVGMTANRGKVPVLAVRSKSRQRPDLLERSPLESSSARPGEPLPPRSSLPSPGGPAIPRSGAPDLSPSPGGSLTRAAVKARTHGGSVVSLRSQSAQS